MPLEDAHPFPTRGAALRLPVSFRDTSGNLITGWTDPSSLITNDGSTSAVGAVPVEVDAPSGMGYVDLTAEEMDSPLVQVRCTITNANFTHFNAAIYTSDMRDTAGRVLRLDRMFAQLFRRWFNKAHDSGTDLTLYGDDDETEMASGSVTTTGTTTTRGRLA